MNKNGMAYCDYIAHTIIRPAMLEDVYSECGGVVREVGHVKMDLDPREGYMISTTKRLDVVDMNGKTYRITIEEVD